MAQEVVKANEYPVKEGEKPYVIKDGQINIFKNKEWKEGDKFPEYTGSLAFQGELYKVALWVRTSAKTGRKYMSGVFDKVRPVESGSDKPAIRPVEDDDLPF